MSWLTAMTLTMQRAYTVLLCRFPRRYGQCGAKGDGQGRLSAGHRFSNTLLTGVLSWIFGNQCSDILSGYRAMSRRFVKSFPALSHGFEIETEITVHALELGLRIDEITAPYKERPTGSVSKLHTFRDGLRILWVIYRLTDEGGASTPVLQYYRRRNLPAGAYPCCSHSRDLFGDGSRATLVDGCPGDGTFHCQHAAAHERHHP